MDRKIFIDQKIVKTIFEKKNRIYGKISLKHINTAVYGESISFSSKI